MQGHVQMHGRYLGLLGRYWYVYMYVYMHACMYISKLSWSSRLLLICTYAHTHALMYACLCICMYVCKDATSSDFGNLMDGNVRDTPVDARRHKPCAGPRAGPESCTPGWHQPEPFLHMYICIYTYIIFARPRALHVARKWCTCEGSKWCTCLKVRNIHTHTRQYVCRSACQARKQHKRLVFPGAVNFPCGGFIYDYR